MSAFIKAIGTANPKFKVSQKEVLNFMQKAHDLNEEESKKLEVLYRATGIQHRYSVLEDYKRNNGFTFFPDNKTLSPFPSTKARNELYKKEAIALSKQAVANCTTDQSELDEITHLITVTCTGLFAPGLDIELVQSLNLKKSVQRTAINFMGCYAAFNAMKVAHAICTASETAKVLIVCTELCSVHFQKENTEDNFLANALFGDGSAAAIIQSEQPAGVSLSIDNFFCDLLPNGSEEMAWNIGNNGFEMKLSAYVPDVIKNGVTDLIDRLKNNLQDMNFDFYAVHPGGRKILNVLEDALSISKEDNRYAYDILKNFGNMSSPTILFVLSSIFKKLSAIDDGKRILSFAFGPGLTLESMVFKIAANGQ